MFLTSECFDVKNHYNNTSQKFDMKHARNQSRELAQFTPQFLKSTFRSCSLNLSRARRL